ncbi:cytochrome c biogenesis protein CcsA [Psychroflexus halocasei]|uniref:Cytochrome c-type biogenesis protein CcsB n=1 Tax=Psychroflexus halocasei TaxID=908615 RepID=A0A1H3ZSG0_9FLAO|nr:cytochrome c biogenesis protein CcsA [Psychroflexus halocasei]SEA26703.1 cytochrome c-type biogenesis protein CcsB [Psychroflexus halocasei]
MLQKKIANILFSTRLMAVLFIIYAVAMAVGTFVENSFATITAREWIYDAWWFEVIMVFFVINFLGNISRYKLWRKERLTTLVLHLSFILILVGAFITRYIGEEGIMPIREGEVTDVMLSEKTYISSYIDGEIDGEPRRRVEDHQIDLGPKISVGKTINTDFNGDPIKFEVIGFIQNAEEGIREAQNGDTYLKLVESGGGDRHDHYLKSGDVANIHNVLFAFNKQTDGAINITGTNESGFTIDSPFDGDWMRMADQAKGQLVKDSVQELKMRSLYNVGKMQFVIPENTIQGVEDLVKIENPIGEKPDGVKIKITAAGENDTINLIGGQGMVQNFKKTNVGGYDVHLRYGSREIQLPFSLKLVDFIAEKQPGTADRSTPSYAAFISDVEVIDGSDSYPYSIYMNHVLDHGGYRFFQASFDPDELGTVLSVNHDWWGTWVTYIGYFLLYLGMMLIMFDKNSRFGTLRKSIDKVKKKKASLTAILLIFFSLTSFAQTESGNVVEEQTRPETSVDSVATNQTDDGHQHDNSNASMPPMNDIDEVVAKIKESAVPKDHAKNFGKLVIQDFGGRMKPINTYSSQLLRKLGKQDSYEGLNGDQIMISMLENPILWYTAPIISLKADNDSIHHILGVEDKAKYTSLINFFNPDGSYKLGPYLEAAYRAKVPNQFQKDFKNADERVNLLYNTLQGKMLKVFPVPNHHNNKWVSYSELDDETYFAGNDTLYTKSVLSLYLQSLQEAKQTDDYTKPESILTSINNFQHKYGKEVLPADKKVEVEILYNEIDIFNRLFKYYLYVGVFMIVLVLVEIFKPSKPLRIAINASKIIVLILFLAHTAGLIARWYISGHAPWSDAYESMIYVAWATMFFGLAFGRKSDLTLAATTFVGSIILMIAHWNWMDPSIGNLEPVLDSYWLMIHVAVIVGSYGPFALSTIIGLLSLFLMIFMTKSNQKLLKLNIRELSLINEVSLIVGLVMLTIGNFLGGQWANESWGRYWGWDPKETWALISIFVYAFVIHMRLVPGLKGVFAFNWATVIAFASILMTYFGVNFYLAGLHSYASGDQIISYKFILISLGVWLVLGFFAYRKYKKFYK